VDQRWLQQGLQAQLTRRSTLRGAGAVGLAGVLAARGAGIGAAQEATPAAVAYPEVVITATDYEFDVPATIDGGWTLLTLVNEGEMDHHAFFLRYTGEDTIEELQAALETPDFGAVLAISTSIGGCPSVGAGGRASVAMNLAPGQYILVCAIPDDEGTPHYMLGMQSMVEVGPRAGNALPAFADTKITLVDYGFEGQPAETAAGSTLWEVFNDGEQPHEMNVFRLAPGVPFDVAAEIFGVQPGASPGASPSPMAMDMSSPEASPAAMGPPFTVVAGAGPMSPGNTVWAVLDLEPGDYFSMCFIPDAESGAPHFSLGMIQPFTVV